MKKRTLFIIIAAIAVIIFAVYEFNKTYALFESQAIATITQQQANWIIEINGTNIVSDIEKDFEVNEINMATNSHVMPGKIAPAITGDFYITIDPKNTQVAVMYTIVLDQTQITNDKIKITSVEEIQEHNTLVKTAADSYTGIMELSDIQAGKINKIQFSISWENDETNNESDTEYGTKSNPKLNIPIEVHLSQYLGEEIIPVDE